MNIEQLEKLNELREKGIITREQFEIEKKKILQSDSDVKSYDNLSKPKINWKHLGLSFSISVIYFFLICFLSAFFKYATASKDSIFPQLVIISAVFFTFYAIKKETYKYRYCSSAWAIFFYIIFCIPLAIWVVSYQFLQINTGCASLIESKNIKKRNKILTNIGIAILLIITVGVIFSLYTQATSYHILQSNKTISMVNNRKKLADELHSAVLGGKLEEVKQLIANGADVNISKDDECYLDDYATPLLLAIYDGTGDYANKDSVEIAKILIESGADVNAVCNTKSGAEVNPLSLAIGDIQIMKLLIKAGADVNAKIKRNLEPDMTMLAYALHYADSQAVEELLSNGADYNADYAGNKIANLCLYIVGEKSSEEKYKNFTQNCSSLLQYIKKENPKALQNNSTSSVVLPSEYNQRLFRNIESKEFQTLLQQGIEQYLINYLKETGNQPYSGKLDDYLSIFTPYIPLPEKPVVLNNTNIEFTYGTYEIAAGYIGPISFSITKEKLKPFLIKR
ncbi:MAG: ankyrin repeat domain-containing protein [Alphaproteobacteria bacterium]|nr:ankyrin repeat domain-containing protein [Alphaproteobacteria bacterium]